MFRKNFKIKQIIIVVLIFLLTIGLLFGGERLAERFLERKPLNERADSIKEITDYTVTKDKATGDISLGLELNDVDNLQETVELFIKDIEEIKEGKVTRVEVESPLSPELRDVFYELSFSLEEARTSGRYKSLFEYLRTMEEEEQGQFRVYIGSRFLFVQLEKNDDRYYSIIPRELSGVNLGTGTLEGGGA